MEDGLEILPLALHVLVGLHLNLALAPFESVGLIARDEVVEHKGIGTLHAVFGQHSEQQQVHALGLVSLQSPQHVPPSEGPEPSAAALLQRLRQRRDGDAHGHGLVAGAAVFYNGDEAEVGQGGSTS